MNIPEKPMTREEMYLNRLAAGTGEIPEYPMTRYEAYLDMLCKNGGGYTKAQIDSMLAGKGSKTDVEANTEAIVAKADKITATSENDGLLSATDKQAYDETVSRSVENEITIGYSAKNLVNLPETLTASREIIFNINPPLPAGNYIFSMERCSSTDTDTNTCGFRTYRLDDDEAFGLTYFFKRTESYQEYFVEVPEQWAQFRMSASGGAWSTTAGDTVTIFKPMIRDARIKDDTYVPYNPPLTDTISKSIENEVTIGYSSKNHIKESDFANDSTRWYTVDLSTCPQGEWIFSCNIVSNAVKFTALFFENESDLNNINNAMARFSCTQQSGEYVNNIIFNRTARFVKFYFEGNHNVNNVMVRDARITDDTYKPYMPPLIDTVSKSIENEVTIGYSAKNKLQNEALSVSQASDATVNGNSITHNGVTYTILDDGSISTSGDATDNSMLYLQKNVNGSTLKNMFDNGDLLSGVPNTSTDNLRIYIQTGNGRYRPAYDSGNGGAIDYKQIIDSEWYDIYIYIKSGTNTNGIIFKPMICDGRITDSAYKPYQKTIAERLAALEAAAGIS